MTRTQGRYANVRNIKDFVELSRDCSLLSHGIKALVKAMKSDWRADPAIERPKRQSQRRLSPEQIQELAEAYRAGEAAKELTVWFNISRGTLFEHLKRLGISRRIRVGSS